MSDIAGVTWKVQTYLQAFLDRVILEGPSEFSVRNGSSHGFVRVWGHDEPEAPTFVRISVQLLTDVPETPELLEYVAYHADDYAFGHLALHRFKDGVLALMMVHTLLGDYLDLEELRSAVVGMMLRADDLDEELQARFGGERFHED